MSARIFVLCLLSSVISTAASLKCQSCFACKEECKNEDMKSVDCGPDEEYCLSLSFRSTMIPGRELMKPNGFYCPGSYEQNGSSEQNGSVLCLGDENQCFTSKFTTYALSAFHSTVTAQGCTIRNACTYPEREMEYGNGLLRLNIERVECQNPEGLEGWNSFSRTFGRGWN
ncbi:uncharacterized protein LOC117659763 isoform X2 [Pantherophis guttatus]|uniref:Uncharacterized protein LOC117659763 isoform X2 n=1 Tax=Pantherophis guttatus TaxID=94885 RepID=A0ABM3YPK4_PANGU|nr:uncharacterized protein LOC117659763 isoform X2 [Pantherophis guttatus]